MAQRPEYIKHFVMVNPNQVDPQGYLIHNFNKYNNDFFKNNFKRSICKV